MQVPYECPRCNYKTPKKSSIKTHFIRQKSCPAVVNNINLTEEIKECVLENRVYKVKDETKTIVQNINYNNTMINFVGNMDAVEKIMRVAQYQQVGINSFDNTCEQTYEAVVNKMDIGTFDLYNSKPDFMEIVNRLTSARDNSKDRRLKLENLNCLYDIKRKRLRVYDGTWDDHLDNSGLEFIANTIVDRYLEAYEIYIIKNIYGDVVLTGLEASEARECLKDYYKFIACFDIKPYATEKALQDSYFDEVVREQIYKDLGEMYDQINDSMTKTYFKDIHKQMMDIIKSNTYISIAELDKAIIGIVNVQSDFKQLLFAEHDMGSIEIEY
jgi:hypothetical protein